MSVKLYNNTEGKILMSVGNKLIKQPYEFGNVFKNNMGLNNYLEITGLNITNGYSIIGICNTANISGDFGLLQMTDTNQNFTDNFIIQAGRTLAQFKDNTNILIANTTDRTLKCFYIEIVNNSKIDSGSTLYTGSNALAEMTRDKLILGASGYYHKNNAIGVSHYLHALMSINCCSVFDRALSLSEYLYFRNNLLFNDFQSTQGLKHHYNLNHAEVININGTDTVGVLDIVGGKHAIVHNLPAGTLQQKVDYANANLFVPF